MKALDTNVVLRLITGEGGHQVDRAIAVLQDTTVLITLTVAMETEWVLRSAFGWSRSRIADAFVAFKAIDNVRFEETVLTDWAIERLRAGADFADLIHSISAREADVLVTFDRRMAKSAGADTPIVIETLR